MELERGVNCSGLEIPNVISLVGGVVGVSLEVEMALVEAWLVASPAKLVMSSEVFLSHNSTFLRSSLYVKTRSWSDTVQSNDLDKTLETEFPLIVLSIFGVISCVSDGRVSWNDI